MASATPLLPRLLSSCVAVANNAGKVVRDVLKQGDLQIVQKEHAKDLQTEADRAAQRYIVSSLASHFPNITLIGEEDDELKGGEVTALASIEPINVTCPQHLANLTEKQVVVWVDPLDGTSEYTQGLLDHVTVLIGIAAGGKTVAGVIHQPYYNYQTSGAELGRTVWGVVGEAGKGEIGGLTVLPPPSGCVVATTRSHASQTVNDAVTSCNPTEVLRVGGAGHKVLLLLDGHAHAYVFASPGCKKWDTCAPEAVLVAAGGTLTDIKGDPILYHKDVEHRNSTGVLATAPGLDHLEFLNKIPNSVKNNLQK
ncbi:Inositol monophosphatase-like [Trinorchestia longiramus]|nr:Inositol monophosphatase-like [Trinorchestia longiramus]